MLRGVSDGTYDPLFSCRIQVLRLGLGLFCIDRLDAGSSFLKYASLRASHLLSYALSLYQEQLLQVVQSGALSRWLLQEIPIPKSIDVAVPDPFIHPKRYLSEHTGTSDSSDETHQVRLSRLDGKHAHLLFGPELDDPKSLLVDGRVDFKVFEEVPACFSRVRKTVAGIEEARVLFGGDVVRVVKVTWQGAGAWVEDIHLPDVRSLNWWFAWFGTMHVAAWGRESTS